MPSGLAPFPTCALVLLTAGRARPREPPARAAGPVDYFPPPESRGGWRTLDKPDDLRRLGGMDPDRLAELKEWLLAIASERRRRGKTPGTITLDDPAFDFIPRPGRYSSPGSFTNRP